jgi:hypothetical protein
LSGPLDLLVIDDDHATSRRDVFAASLRSAGVTLASGGALVIALFGDLHAGRGRVGYAPETLAATAAACNQAAAKGRPTLVVQFGPPRWASALTDTPNIVSAWGGDRTMQTAAARWLKRAAL